jgi:hypothetical protein
MTEEELSKQDIALLNPRATDGLPGTENVNVAELLAQLSTLPCRKSKRWANTVA